MFLLHEHEPNKMAHWFKMPLCENKTQLDLEIVMIWQVQLLTSLAGLSFDQKFAMNPWAHPARKQHAEILCCPPWFMYTVQTRSGELYFPQRKSRQPPSPLQSRMLKCFNVLVLWYNSALLKTLHLRKLCCIVCFQHVLGEKLNVVKSPSYVSYAVSCGIVCEHSS